MPPCLVVSVGGCGVRLGLAFWDRLLAEHGVGPDGSIGAAAPSSATFFRRYSSTRVGLRALFVDSEPGILDTLRRWPATRTIAPADIVLGSSGCGNNFAKGRYAQAGLIAEARARIGQRLTESGCRDVLLVLSVDGGTGAGVGAGLAEALRDDFPDLCQVCVAVLTPRSHTDIVVTPYNQVLSLADLFRDTDLVVLLDNGSLSEAATRAGHTRPDDRTRNLVASEALALLTAPLRLPPRRLGLRALADLLRPLPWCRLAGLAVGPAGDPLACEGLSGYRGGEGRCLSPVFLPRSGEEPAGTALRADPRLLLPAWYPAAVPVLPVTRDTPGTLRVECHTGLGAVLARSLAEFRLMDKRQAFLHWYLGEGMQAMQFAVAEKALREVAAAYAEEGEE